MPNFTKVLSKAFDVIRLVTTTDPRLPLKLLDAKGQQIGELITKGWLPEELAPEPGFGRLVEIHITNRPGWDFSKVVYCCWGGYKYERLGFANPPTANPQEWIWQVKPVGRDNS